MCRGLCKNVNYTCNPTEYSSIKIGENSENSVNAAVIIAKGINIDEWIEVFDRIFIEELWCKVAHQSTENLIIGIFTEPTIMNTAAIFSPTLMFENDCFKKITTR